LEDAQAEFIITCDGAYRGGKDIPLKDVIDDALIGNKKVKKVIVYTRTRTPVSMIKGRDLWWEDEMDHAETQVEKDGVVSFPAEEMDAEDPLFILYTSGSTGKPKGVVHTCAGYMIWTTYTFVNVFQYKPGEIHFCTADIGWVTGHSYIVYGPLCAGATSVMFEGIPTYPDAGRFWDIVDKHKVNIIYTAPTALRSLMGFGLEPLKGKDPAKRSADLFEKAGDFHRAAEEHARAGEPLQAARAYEAAFEYAAAIDAYTQAGATDKALELLEKTGRFFEAGTLALEQGDADRAIRCFQQVGSRDGDYVEACEALVSLFADKQAFDLALVKAREVIDARGADDAPLDAQESLARLLERAGQPAEALVVWENIRKRNFQHEGASERIEALRESVAQTQRARGSGAAPGAGGGAGGAAGAAR
jgi:hypothetical protein